MGPKKNFKYYLMIFGIAVLAIAIYAVINWISTGKLDTNLVLLAFIIPTVFTIFLFLFDKIFDRIFPKQKKAKEQKDGFDKFVSDANVSLKREGSFSIQDYRTLQDSDRFQKTLKQLHTITTEGEKPDLTYEYLGNKFKKSTVEYKAIQVIIREVKKLD